MIELLFLSSSQNSESADERQEALTAEWHLFYYRREAMLMATSPNMFSEMDAADRGAVYKPTWIKEITGVLPTSPCFS